MAQNDVQKYTTDQDLYNNIRNPLETWYHTFDKLEKMANFLNSADSGTYPGVPVGTLTDIASLRTTINTYLDSTDTLAMLAKVKEFVRI